MNISSLKPLRLPWKTRRTPGLVPRSPPPRLKPRKRSSWRLSCVGPPLCSVWFSSVFSILLPVFSWLSCWVNFFSNFHFQDSCWAFWWPTLPAPEDGTRPKPELQALHQAMGGYEHDLWDGQHQGPRGEECLGLAVRNEAGIRWVQIQAVAQPPNRHPMGS